MIKKVLLAGIVGVTLAVFGVTTVMPAQSATTSDPCHDDSRQFCPELFTGANWAEAAEAAGYVTASWKLALLDCLNQHEPLLTDECVDSLDNMAALNAEVNNLCRADRRAVCPGVRPSPGSSAGNECLLEHFEDLSLDCQEAIQAWDEARSS